MTSIDAQYRPVSDDVDDADLAEQRTPASSDPDEIDPSPRFDELRDDVPEADAVEQAVSVPYGDEDYR